MIAWLTRIGEFQYPSKGAMVTSLGLSSENPGGRAAL